MPLKVIVTNTMLLSILIIKMAELIAIFILYFQNMLQNWYFFKKKIYWELPRL